MNGWENLPHWQLQWIAADQSGPKDEKSLG